MLSFKEARAQRRTVLIPLLTIDWTKTYMFLALLFPLLNFLGLQAYNVCVSYFFSPSHAVVGAPTRALTMPSRSRVSPFLIFANSFLLSLLCVSASLPYHTPTKSSLEGSPLFSRVYAYAATTLGCSPTSLRIASVHPMPRLNHPSAYLCPETMYEPDPSGVPAWLPQIPRGPRPVSLYRSVK